MLCMSNGAESAAKWFGTKSEVGSKHYHRSKKYYYPVGKLTKVL